MASTEHKACLSTSTSLPSPSPLPTDEGEELPRDDGASVVGDDEYGDEYGDGYEFKHRRESSEGEAAVLVDAQEQPSEQQPWPKPDYILVFCYMILYFEVAWLILMLVRDSRH